MNLRPIFRATRILAVLGLIAFGVARLEAEEPVAPLIVATTACQNYPEVTCTSSDALACADALQLASDARDQLGPLLNLGPAWRFPVHIHIMTPDDPLLAKIHREAAAVFTDERGMRIEAVLPSTDPDARAFIQRQYVTALLWEKFFATTKTFDARTKLDVVPLWLVEGLREWLNDDPENDRVRIVKRAIQGQLAPALAEVTTWRELSGNRLKGLWQRAFCFYLVDSLVQPGVKREVFQQWLATFSGSNPASARGLFPTETDWQRQLVEATDRSQELVYSWDETVSALAAAEVIALPSNRPGDQHICMFDTVCTLPLDAKMDVVLQQKVIDLTGLELRAHVSWHPILELYRAGLSDLVNGKNPDEAKKLLAEAHELRVAEMTNHQKLVDYLNWFEVTKNYSGNMSSFNSYFMTARQMEQMEVDPTHPNPIRDNLIQVESHF